jgi:hypothetical protein
MRFIINNRGDQYQIFEELKCPFNEKKDYIILNSGEVIYWQNAKMGFIDKYFDKKLDIEMMKEYINEIDITNWRSEKRKQQTLGFLRETLSKMIAYKREIKIDGVLNKITPEDEYKYWVC